MKRDGKKKLTKEHLRKLQAGRELRWEKERQAKMDARDANLAALRAKQTCPEASLILPGLYDWLHAPMDESMQRLNDMRREFDRVTSIMLQRQREIAPTIWPCWTQKHKAEVPKKTWAECHKEVKDGRWVFKDDGYRDPQTKMPAPIVCCSQLCFLAYQMAKPVAGLGRH